MSAKYTVIPKTTPGKPDAPKKFYPSFKSGGRISTRELIGHISDISTISPIDSLAMVEGLLMVIPQELTKGNIVELGDFGSFRVTIQTSGEDKAEDVSAKNIKGARVVFMPGKLFKRALAGMEFKKG
ncbi:MAG: HU family DNA-binding protein [Anaerolineales bacterium]